MLDEYIWQIDITGSEIYITFKNFPNLWAFRSQRFMVPNTR